MLHLFPIFLEILFWKYEQSQPIGNCQSYFRILCLLYLLIFFFNYFLNSRKEQSKNIIIQSDRSWTPKPPNKSSHYEKSNLPTLRMKIF